MRDSYVSFHCVIKACVLGGILCLALTLLYFLNYSGFNRNYLPDQQRQPQSPDPTSQIDYVTISQTNIIENHIEAAKTKDETLETKGKTVNDEVADNSNLEKSVLKEPESRTVLQKCPDPSPLLVGPMKVEFSKPVNLDEVRKSNSNLQEGGWWRPSSCMALQKVAIIIPFRLRDEHLKFWLSYLHPILQRQQLDYGIYVINQDGEGTFNRAKLMNVGFMEALKKYSYDCFVFSDVDLIPMDDRNIYKCYSQPRHLSVSVDKFSFKLPYKQIFGGVAALSKEQYLKINGFPNNYWGWGGEDDDIYNRMSSKGMSISRPDSTIGRYRMIIHKRDEKNEPNPQRFNRIKHTRQTMNSDGINSLSYKVVRVENDKLFTKVTVDLGKP